MIPVYGDAPIPGQKYGLRPGAYVVLYREGSFLFTYQKTKEIDELQLPGGGIDPGENPVPALQREVMEETGWTMSRPVRLGAYRRFVYMPDYHVYAEKLCQIYVARPISKLGDPTEAGHTAVWLSGHDALSEIGSMVFHDRRILTRLSERLIPA